MGMKFACQHLLCRRDLSCTKVNAVNRLSDCLDSSFGLRREEAAPPAAAEHAPQLLSGSQGPGPSAHRALGELAGRSVGSKQRDAALQTGKCFEQVSPVS